MAIHTIIISFSGFLFRSLGNWVAPLGRDALRPEPMNGMGFSKVDQHRAILFGGKTIQGYMNELFVFDLSKKVRH